MISQPRFRTRQARKVRKNGSGVRGSEDKNFKGGRARRIELLRRKEGATIADIAKATGWQNHSIRGFLSGTVTKKMGLKIESSKDDAGVRTYRL